MLQMYLLRRSFQSRSRDKALHQSSPGPEASGAHLRMGTNPLSSPVIFLKSVPHYVFDSFIFHFLVCTQPYSYPFIRKSGKKLLLLMFSLSEVTEFFSFGACL